MRPKTATEAAATLLARVNPSGPPAERGGPGTRCYTCGLDRWWRLGPGFPWICDVCHPREVP